MISGETAWILSDSTHERAVLADQFRPIPPTELAAVPALLFSDFYAIEVSCRARYTGWSLRRNDRSQIAMSRHGITALPRACPEPDSMFETPFSATQHDTNHDSSYIRRDAATCPVQDAKPLIRFVSSREVRHRGSQGRLLLSDERGIQESRNVKDLFFGNVACVTGGTGGIGFGRWRRRDSRSPMQSRIWRRSVRGAARPRGSLNSLAGLPVW